MSTPHPTRPNTDTCAARRGGPAPDAALASTQHVHSQTRTIPSAAQAFAAASPEHSLESSPLGSPDHSPNATLPSSPSFDVRAAAETCRHKTGYVSFMDIDGLGAPAGAACDDDVDCSAPGRRRERSWSWSQLLGFTPGSTIMPPPAPTSAPAPKTNLRDGPPPSAFVKRR
jgi:hypothetical protein